MLSSVVRKSFFNCCSVVYFSLNLKTEVDLLFYWSIVVYIEEKDYFDQFV